MKRCCLLIIVFLTVVSAQQPNWQSVENTLGRKGVVQGDMYKVTFPRSDTRVSVGDVVIEPGLALTSWVAFMSRGDHVMLMGDLVLLETEIAPVEKTLIENHLEISAIHNHVLEEQPKIIYMHIAGEGKAETLAEAVNNVLRQTATLLGPSQLSPKPTAIDWSNVESVLGLTGKHNGNLLQLSLPRKEKITEHGMDIPPFMGMATAINLQRVDSQRAATTGDFVLLADEVNPVVKALNEHAIVVTALHSHMLFESPRLFFLHFWAVGDPKKIAEGLKAAVDKTNSVK